MEETRRLLGLGSWKVRSYASAGGFLQPSLLLLILLLLIFALGVSRGFLLKEYFLELLAVESLLLQFLLKPFE